MYMRRHPTGDDRSYRRDKRRLELPFKIKFAPFFGRMPPIRAASGVFLQNPTNAYSAEPGGRPREQTDADGSNK